jgi:hypothetical protein
MPLHSPPAIRPARQAQQMRAPAVHQAHPRCIQRPQFHYLFSLPQVLLSRASAPLFRISIGHDAASSHRHPTSHMCTPVSPTAEPVENTKARALLAKVSASSASTPRTSAKRAVKPPTDPTKLAAFQKIQRMKMRHKAIPLDPKDKTLSPPLDQRLHIEVCYGEMTRVFWLRKVCIRVSQSSEIT